MEAYAESKDSGDKEAFARWRAYILALFYYPIAGQREPYWDGALILPPRSVAQRIAGKIISRFVPGEKVHRCSGP